MFLNPDNGKVIKNPVIIYKKKSRRTVEITIYKTINDIYIYHYRPSNIYSFDESQRRTKLNHGTDLTEIKQISNYFSILKCSMRKKMTCQANLIVSFVE